MKTNNKMLKPLAGLLNALSYISQAEDDVRKANGGLILEQARQREKFMWMQVYEAAREFVAAYEENENARKN